MTKLNLNILQLNKIKNNHIRQFSTSVPRRIDPYSLTYDQKVLFANCTRTG